MLIPHTSLQPQVLDAMIEEYVTRDGAVHGHADASLQTRIDTLRRQLERGLIEIHFDEQDESWTFVQKHR